MKKILFGLIILLSACQRFEPFTFVQMSDPQIGFLDDSPAYRQSGCLFKTAVEEVNAISPSCVIITGDLINNPSDPVQDSVYRACFSEIAAPVYVVPGNHDYLGFTREKQEAYIASRGYDRFSVKLNGCAFIGIDSNCIKESIEDAEEEQLTWLKKELDAARKCRYTFVFLHCPVIRESIDEPEDYFNFPAEKRRQYIDLFKAYGVDAVFAGHCHEDYSTDFEGIRFITAGSVGNALGHGKPGYNVVNVTDTGIDAHFTPSSYICTCAESF